MTPVGDAGVVLVVEDEPINMVLVKLLLERAGFVVFGARDVAEADAQLEERAFDAVLLDINVPGGGGAEVLRRIRERPSTSCLQVVAVTALAMAGDRERLLGLGCDDYVSKPIDVAGLRFKVEAAVTRTRSART